MQRFATAGILIWLGATIVLRIAGQFVFRDTGLAATVLVLLVSVPLMVLIARGVLAGVPPADRTLGAIALVTPGMVLDTFSTIWFARVFPNMRPDVAALFGGWLLLCNAVVLLTAALWREPVRTGRALATRAESADR